MPVLAWIRSQTESMWQVDTEITQMREGMQRTKTHYESLCALVSTMLSYQYVHLYYIPLVINRMRNVEANAQQSVSAAQHVLAEVRGQLEQTIVDNKVLVVEWPSCS